MNRAEIHAERLRINTRLDSLGRPVTDWAPIGALQASMAAQRRWDSEHPERSQQWLELLTQLDELDAAEKRIDADERLVRHLEGFVMKAGLSERDVAAAKAPADGEAMSAARTWWAQGDTRKAWLVLLGGVGTGKTVAASWLALEALRDGQTAAYVRSSALARVSSFDEGRIELDRLKRVGLLVVDDVGAEHLTGHAAATLNDLFDTRHAQRRHTVVCANLEGKQLAERLGERLADRIRSDSMRVMLRGKSMRGAA